MRPGTLAQLVPTPASAPLPARRGGAHPEEGSLFPFNAKLCPTLATPWIVAHQTPLSMGFSRQEAWSGLPFPSPGDLPDPGIEAGSPALQADSLPTELQGKTRLKGRVPQTLRHHVPTHMLQHDGRRTREQALEQWAPRTGRTKTPGNAHQLCPHAPGRAGHEGASGVQSSARLSAEETARTWRRGHGDPWVATAARDPTLLKGRRERTLPRRKAWPCWRLELPLSIFPKGERVNPGELHSEKKLHPFHEF